MHRPLLILVLLVLLPAAALAASLDDLEGVGRAYRNAQPDLQSYRVTVVTDRIDQMVSRMTANMPGNLPRPQPPMIRKYWSREAQKGVMVAEGPGVFPYMQEMVERFSREFAVEIRALFLPPGMEERRRELAGRATAHASENLLGDLRTVSLTLTFPHPVDLGGAFYGPGLELPQQEVTALSFDFDPDRRLLRRLEVVTANGPLVVEVRHREVTGGFLPREVLVTNPAGTVDDRFLTEFLQVGEFWLPGRQEQIIRRPDRSDSLTVTFRDYGINVPLPAQVRSRLAGS